MFTDIMVRPEAAASLSALIALGGMWAIKTHLLAHRIRRSSWLKQAAELRSNLFTELETLEAHSRSMGESHGQKIAEFRSRAECLYRGVKFQKIAALEDTCLRLAVIMREVRNLAEAVDGRIVPQPAAVANRRAPQEGAGKALGAERHAGEGLAGLRVT